MSTPVYKLIKNWYDSIMKNPEVAKWFRDKYFEWETKSGRPRSVSDFSEFLGLSQPTGSAYINGTRKPNFETAIRICEILSDNSLLDLLGYSNPESLSLESLSEDLKSRLKSALLEIRETVNEKSLDPESPEAKLISEEVLKKHGFIVNSND